jgi:hypothetical protein
LKLRAIVRRLGPPFVAVCAATFIARTAHVSGARAGIVSQSVATAEPAAPTSPAASPVVPTPIVATPVAPQATPQAPGVATLTPAAAPTPEASTSGAPAGAAAPGTPVEPAASASVEPGASPTPTPTPAPTPTPTPQPIIVDPPNTGVTPGGSQRLHVSQTAGTVTLAIADPGVVSASYDPQSQTLTLVGKALGATTVTVTDGRGQTRDVGVRVAYPAGSIASDATVRITGNPATQLFVRDEAVAAAVANVALRPGASVVPVTDDVNVAAPLAVDDITSVAVPLIVQGEAYFTVQGSTRVRVVNFAQPSIEPQSLLVSDFPERLSANGILFTADLTAKGVERFLYYHYNPAGQPDRRIVLKAQNTSSQPALVQFIRGQAGPDINEMQVGHLSTQRFLVRRAQNEGSVITIPGNTTFTIAQQPLPARSIVSAILQLHEIEGAPLHLTLVAQNLSDPIDGPIPTSALLVGDVPHARGIYPIPEFFFDYSYDAEGPDLEIPIGQIPLPNLVRGQTLAGDYGVLQSVTIRIVNNDRHNARQIALYASPRGGRATGTFIIDRVLVQAHAMPPYGHYKLRQYTVPPGSFVRTEIVTMPEGGSSYPLRLVVAPDDGSAAPGSSDSAVY